MGDDSTSPDTPDRAGSRHDGDQSMRGLFETLARRGELVDIDRPVDARFELGSVLTLLDRGPAVRFNNVTGSALPVVGNLLTDRDRIAAALGVPKAGILDALSDAIASRQPTEEVTVAPCQELRFPAADVWREVVTPTFFEKDSGGYITAGMIVAHDPVTGSRNASYARIKPLEQTTGFVGIAPNHHLSALARSAATAGRGLPVAVTLGSHPAIQLAACFYLGLGDDELEHAGRLLGEPVRVVKATTSEVLVPADAEVVVEGVLRVDRPVHEGLVSEYHGMYEDYGDGCTLEVTAVTRRADASVQVVLPGFAAEHSFLGALPIAAGLRHALRGFGCRATDLAVTLSGGGRVDVVVALPPEQRRQAKRAIFGCFATVSMIKQVTVVDSDIDVWDAEHVHWARTSRMRWERDLVLVPAVPCDRNVPMQQDGTVTKVGMDATAKPGDRAVGNELAVPPRETLDRVREWLADDGLSDMVRPSPTLWGLRGAPRGGH
ncbi:UbiD family decarboxylase [Streptomyces sp. NBC_01023]|uniref:UbiD family decarboxylase domain-containing protein n=1 Tax=Streptomyces sp. NBC_01023 TaxID=2903724 RepID=UPI0038700177|nr:UbiD family decarboxylase [Streptomyces sp. NBC_01023]